MKLLKDTFRTEYDRIPFPCEIEDDDARNDVLLMRTAATFYATVLPLDDTHLTPDLSDDKPFMDWNSRRAWYDESIKVAKHYDLNNGYDWERQAPGHVDTPRDKDNPAISDSYTKSDYSLWSYLRQEERPRAITLTFDGINRRDPNTLLEDVDTIVLQECQKVG